MKLLGEFAIVGGRVIDPANAIDRTGWVHVREGRIAGIGTDATAPPAGVPQVDATGLIVAPGLVDPHVHLREPGQTHKEDIASGSAAAAAGGFTTVCCMPNTNPAIDSVGVVEEIQTKAEQAGLCRVRAIAAATIGRKGVDPVDFAALQGAGAIAFSDDGDGIEDDDVCRAVMRGVREIDSVLYPHCEFKHLSHSGVMHLGAVSRKLGLIGYDPRGEEAMIERDLKLVAETGVRYHVAHISTAKGIAMVAAAKQQGLPVTTEVCPHHLLLCDEDVIDANGNPDSNFKMSPPLRSRADVRACIDAVRTGVIDCVVTDHAPHALAEKNAGFLAAPMGIVGLETSLGCAAAALLDPPHFGWPELIARMSTTACRIFNLPGGTLSTGGPADITVIDPAGEWVVDPSTFRSKSRNTPFAGWRLPCRAVVTLLAGQVTYVTETHAKRITTGTNA